MANVLRVGLVAALAVLGLAVAALIVEHPGSGASAWITQDPLGRYLDVRALGSGLAHGTPTAYLALGTFALIATPVVRVVAGTAAFARHGERRMAGLTAAVLALLLFGLFVVGPLVR